MRNVSRPRLALPLAVLVAVAATVVSACSTFAGPAWRVGDVSVSVDQFYADYEASQATSAASTSTTSGRIDTTDLAGFMTQQIQKEIVQQVLAQQGIEITQEDRDNAELAIQQQAAQSGQPASPTEDQIANQAAVVALGTKLVKEEVDAGTFDLEAEVRRTFDENADQLPATPPQTCLHAIFILAGDPQSTTGAAPTDEERATAQAAADAAVARLATEDFAAVSKDVSIIDSQYPGGDFGCTETEQLPPDLAAIANPLTPGQISAPVYLETDGGYAILRLDSRTTESVPATFEEYEERITAYVVEQHTSELVSALLRDLVGDMTIVVDPRFGSWNDQTLVVDPPEGAATPTTPTTALTGFDPTSLGGLGVDPSATGPGGS